MTIPRRNCRSRNASLVRYTRMTVNAKPITTSKNTTAPRNTDKTNRRSGDWDGELWFVIVASFSWREIVSVRIQNEVI